MSCEYDRLAIRYSVACICQLMGWNTVHLSALEYLTDITHDYMNVIGKLANRYATLLGQTEVNLDHLAIAFKDIGISVTELEEYSASIDSGPVLDVPVYPLPKESHLNLLKPGSREVVTRPVHIHEHLPPMYPELEEQEEANTKENTTESSENLTPPPPKNSSVFKKPGDPVSSESRRRTIVEEEIRPLREISSVMMTTSGFLSPAREGKLPEARSVIPMEEEHEVEKVVESTSKHVAGPSEIHKVEKKKKKEKSHEFKADRAKEEHGSKHDEIKVKKQKEPKIKSHKNSSKLQVTPIKLEKKSHKLRVALQSPTESHKVSKPLKMDVDDVYDEKLPSEPDRQKLNIFKRISKVKDDTDDFYRDSGDLKETKRLLLKETIESVIQKGRLSSETTKETPVERPPKITSYVNSPGPFDMELPYDDPIYSRPPSTPKTPDIPSGFESKKRKRDKNKEKREKERDKYMSSPKTSRFMGYESPPKPKTPEVDLTCDDSLPSLTYPYNYYQTGLGSYVPPTLNHPLIPASAPLMNLYPKPPNLPMMQSQGKDSIKMPSQGRDSLKMPSQGRDSLKIQSQGRDSLKIPSQGRDSLKIPYSLPPSLTISAVPAPATSSAQVSSTVDDENDNMPIDLSDHSPLKTDPSTSKEKKKDKKLKDKIKKKKAKKEKIKSKDKLERKKLKLEKKERNKDKSKPKKDKKEKKEKKEKKAKKEKKRDRENPEDRVEGIVPKLKVRLLSPDEGSPDRASHRKIVIKPIIKKDEPEDIPVPKSVSASATKIKAKKSDHSMPSTSKPSTSGIRHTSFAGFNLHPSLTITPTPSTSSQEPEGGQQLWICPACRRVDDGILAMIACDSCDMWFHWICVGIQEPPASDWYCQTCIQQKGGLIEKLKKKQKKKKLSAI